MKPRHYQLKNGLPVYTIQSAKSPVVSVQMWVRTGSADETKAESGISHFIEHLVFKGSKDFKVGEIAKTVEGAGGELNAYTSFDQTVFYVTISKNEIDQALHVISEMMGFPLFDKDELNAEREVVIEEIKRGLDSPSRVASQKMFSTLFKKHTYGAPVIGTESNVRAWSVSKIKKFYSDRYSPKNMFLLVSGDFDEKNIDQKINQYFSPIKATKVRKVKRPIEPKLKKNIVSIQETPQFTQTQIMMVWPAPKPLAKDMPALDLLASILGSGDTSRLVQKLRLEKPLVLGIGTSVYSPQDPGLFAISINLKPENFSTVCDEILNVFGELITNPPSVEELSRAVVAFESDKLYSQETVDGLTRFLGQSLFLTKKTDFNEKYVKQVRKLKAQDLIRVFKKYILLQPNIVTGIANSGAADLEKIGRSFQKKLKDISNLKPAKTNTAKEKSLLPKAIWNYKTLKKKAQVEVFEVSPELTVVTKPSQDSHAISVKSAWISGQREEPEGQSGLVELLGRTFGTTTQNFSELQISEQLESMASSIQAQVGRNSIGLSLDGLKAFEKPLLKLYEEILFRAKFDNEIIEREKSVQLHQMTMKKDQPFQIAHKNFLQMIYGKHPNSREMIGTEETLKPLTAKEVSVFFEKSKANKKLVVALAGNVDVKPWIEMFKKNIKKSQGSIQKWAILPTNSATQKQVIESSEKEQAHVIIGFPTFSMFHKDKMILELIQSILAGQGGRLFLELRDKESLAYSVSPLKMDGLEMGYFGCYIGCAPEKTQKAISMMKAELKKLQDTLVSEEEILRSKKYLIGRTHIDLQRSGAQGSSMLYELIYGLDPNESFEIERHLQKITAQDIQRVAKDVFKGEPYLSIVTKS